MSGAVQRRKPSPWEWVVAAVGLVLVLATLGFLLYEKIATTDAAPSLSAHATNITSDANGFLVQFEAVNSGGRTAAGATVEGLLTMPGGTSERSTVTIDFIPGHSKRKGGLFFRKDPRAGKLELSVHGYQKP